MVFTALCFHSCSSSTPEPAAEEVSANDTLIVARSGYFDLTFSLPKSDARLGMLEHGYDEEFGEYRIRMDNGFSIFITEQSAVIADLKTELVNDVLFTYKYHQETPTALHFQRILPDGTEHFHAYYETRNIGGADYLFRTEEMAEITAGDIELIKKTVATFASGKKPA